MQFNNKSPLRYPGGKTRACKILDDILIKYFDPGSFDNLISPFFGGGSFEFYIQNKYGLKIIANDKFTPLYTFWIICKAEKDRLCDKLTSYVDKVDKTEFNNFRKHLIETGEVSDEVSTTYTLNTAIMYFIINRCSFSGATLSGGFSQEASKKRFTNSSIDRIRQLDLSKFEIHNSDFTDFLDSIIDENSKCLTFLDPPYYLEKGSKLYGTSGDLHENFDHLGLHSYISSRKNWIMTYNNCDFIKQLYSDFIIIETSWSYGMNKSKKSSEVVIVCQDK